MREQTPIWYHEPTDHWLVSRFADVNALLRDRRFGRTYHHVATRRRDGPSGSARLARAVLAPDPQRHPRHGASRSHTRASTRLEGLHAPDGGGDARSDPADDGRVGRRRRRRGGVRPDLDARRTAARGGDRRAARRPARGPRPVAPVVRRHLRHVRAAPVRGDGPDRRTGVRRVLRLPPDPLEGAPSRPARRPHQRARAGPRRRGTADGGRADRDMRPAPERGPRGHRERHRERLVVVVPQPGPACPPPRRRHAWCHGRSRS